MAGQGPCSSYQLTPFPLSVCCPPTALAPTLPQGAVLEQEGLTDMWVLIMSWSIDNSLMLQHQSVLGCF